MLCDNCGSNCHWIIFEINVPNTKKLWRVVLDYRGLLMQFFGIRGTGWFFNMHWPISWEMRVLENSISNITCLFLRRTYCLYQLVTFSRSFESHLNLKKKNPIVVRAYYSILIKNTSSSRFVKCAARIK